jgi:hypothetical protein
MSDIRQAISSVAVENSSSFHVGGGGLPVTSEICTSHIVIEPSEREGFFRDTPLSLLISKRRRRFVVILGAGSDLGRSITRASLAKGLHVRALLSKEESVLRFFEQVRGSLEPHAAGGSNGPLAGLDPNRRPPQCGTKLEVWAGGYDLERPSTLPRLLRHAYAVVDCTLSDPNVGGVLPEGAADFVWSLRPRLYYRGKLALLEATKLAHVQYWVSFLPRRKDLGRVPETLYSTLEDTFASSVVATGIYHINFEVPRLFESVARWTLWSLNFLGSLGDDYGCLAVRADCIPLWDLFTRCSPISEAVSSYLADVSFYCPTPIGCREVFRQRVDNIWDLKWGLKRPFCHLPWSSRSRQAVTFSNYWVVVPDVEGDGYALPWDKEVSGLGMPSTGFRILKFVEIFGPYGFLFAWISLAVFQGRCEGPSEDRPGDAPVPVETVDFRELAPFEGKYLEGFLKGKTLMEIFSEPFLGPGTYPIFRDLVKRRVRPQNPLATLPYYYFLKGMIDFQYPFWGSISVNSLIESCIILQESKIQEFLWLGPALTDPITRGGTYVIISAGFYDFLTFMFGLFEGWYFIEDLFGLKLRERSLGVPPWNYQPPRWPDDAL